MPGVTYLDNIELCDCILQLIYFLGSNSILWSNILFVFDLICNYLNYYYLLVIKVLQIFYNSTKLTEILTVVHVIGTSRFTISN